MSFLCLKVLKWRDIGGLDWVWFYWRWRCACKELGQVGFKGFKSKLLPCEVAEPWEVRGLVLESKEEVTGLIEHDSYVLSLLIVMLSAVVHSEAYLFSDERMC